VTIRAAVVGTSFGARIHLPALRSAGFDVVALVGTDAAKTARRAERFGVGNACTSLTQALEVGIDAVSIATPPATHAPLATEAIEGGCHVLCEKPFTLDVPQAASLVDAAARTGRVGMVGHEFRWSHAQSLVEWALLEGRIGEPRLAISISFLSMLREITMPGWWYERDAGGGWLGASGSHRVDALRQWFGEVEAVSAGLAGLSEPSLGVDDGFTIRLKMRDGVEACVVQNASSVGPMFSATRVMGTAGTLWAEGDGVKLADGENPGGVRLDAPEGYQLPDVADLAVGPLADMTRSELPPYIRLATAFRRAIEGGPPPPGPHPATFADGLACMRVLEAARCSAARDGAWIETEGQKGEGP
jgi:predicted dehydrogenase